MECSDLPPENLLHALYERLLAKACTNIPLYVHMNRFTLPLLISLLAVTKKSK